MSNSITLDEIQANITAINNASQDIGRRLLDLREREAWKVLGYKSWTKFLESKPFVHSRKHLYELMKAAPIQEKLVTKGYRVGNKIAVILANYDDHLHQGIIETTMARYGKVTESNITRIADTFQETVRTGCVDTGSGVSTPMDAALTLQDLEALQRNKQRIAESQQKNNEIQLPLTDFEINLVIQAVKSYAGDQEVARVARNLIKKADKKAS